MNGRPTDRPLFMRNRQQLTHPIFNSLEFEGIENEARRNSFSLSAKTSIDATGAIRRRLLKP
jgi:hypothetical protein